jgi:hypothetical protein
MLWNENDNGIRRGDDGKVKQRWYNIMASRLVSETEVRMSDDNNMGWGEETATPMRLPSRLP